METIHVTLHRDRYQIVIGHGCLSEIGKRVAEIGGHSQIVVVTAAPIQRRYGRALLKSLTDAGLTPRLLTIPDGERAKSLRWASHLYDRLIKARCERGTTLVALGGGVVGDLTGFVASTYLRGVGFIQVPTTLVAQVDASIGGKTGVNHPNGKNLIGTFYQPRLVFADVATLRTLPKRELIGGFAEVIKYGVIADPDLFAYLEVHASELLACRLETLEQVVVRSARIKADVVGKDEREAGLRRILNYGHTLGHAIEAAAGYGRVHHGEAISIGMECAGRLAVRLNLCEPSVVDRQRQLLEQFGLPTRLPPRVDSKRLFAAMALDKKVKDGRLHFVLPERLGSVSVRSVNQAAVREVLKELASGPSSRRR
jgi:3-dehydroquinate synthase